MWAYFKARVWTYYEAQWTCFYLEEVSNLPLDPLCLWQQAFSSLGLGQPGVLGWDEDARLVPGVCGGLQVCTPPVLCTKLLFNASLQEAVSAHMPSLEAPQPFHLPIGDSKAPPGSSRAARSISSPV